MHVGIIMAWFMQKSIRPWATDPRQPLYLQENCVLHSLSEQDAKKQTRILDFIRKSVPCKQQTFPSALFSLYSILGVNWRLCFCWGFFDQKNVIKLLGILCFKSYSKNPYLAQIVILGIKSECSKPVIKHIAIIVFYLCRILLVGLNT